MVSRDSIIVSPNESVLKFLILILALFYGGTECVLLSKNNTTPRARLLIELTAKFCSLRKNPYSVDSGCHALCILLLL